MASNVFRRWNGDEWQCCFTKYGSISVREKGAWLICREASHIVIHQRVCVCVSQQMVTVRVSACVGVCVNV